MNRENRIKFDQIKDTEIRWIKTVINCTKKAKKFKNRKY